MNPYTLVRIGGLAYISLFYHQLKMNHPTIASRWNADLIDDNFALWQQDPSRLDAEWRAFFDGFTLANTPANGHASGDTTIGSEEQMLTARLIGAIYAYRSIGHTIAMVNPLIKERPENPRLTLERLGIPADQLDTKLFTGNYLGGVEMSVGEVIERLRKTYCGSIGLEYIHIQETAKRRWIQARIEPDCFQPKFELEGKLSIARSILRAEAFENFLQTRFVGQKRFSLEGGESLLACMETLFSRCEKNNVKEIVMGMAHRGRLNILANVFGKSFEYVFREFSENYLPEMAHGDGDVKYHLGFETTRKTDSGYEVHFSLAANPSHLEAVNPVVEGKARARQRIRGDLERKEVLPLLIHGDAAIAGQGITAEVFNFSKLKGYRTGGTIHIVINNQIGFTTDPSDARSSRYCTDVAKIIEAPVFHVNGNDPLAVAMVCEVAMDYRQTFGEDVVIDLFCWRKHGHNESDEPAFTQPLLYKKISQIPPIGQAFADALVESGETDQATIDSLVAPYQKRLEQAYEAIKAESESSAPFDVFEESSATPQPDFNFVSIDTKVEPKTLDLLADKLTAIPDDFKANRKIIRQFEQKRKIYAEDAGIDWGFAEAMAFGSLLLDGTPVRLSGQDSERGTFSHRHAAIYDIETRERFVPLLNLAENQAQFCVHNSLLSEAAVLGFDFGYSVDYPQMLCLWEAQFGDFVNGAQVIIDQFITSSESKWGTTSGLVMLLPHGYEGQGPEHSSARMERFLQACAEDNIQVCNLTTPAQYFHILRRQMKREFRKPLVIFSPKSLLRHKLCVSLKSDFTEGVFQTIIDDPLEPRKAKRLVLCSGKVYYDLISERESAGIDDVAILRVEQLYPLNVDRLKRIAAQYDGFDSIVWCQEEPQNMGAWSFIAPILMDVFERRIEYVGRKASASPAEGALAAHRRHQTRIVRKALKSN